MKTLYYYVYDNDTFSRPYTDMHSVQADIAAMGAPHHVSDDVIALIRKHQAEQQGVELPDAFDVGEVIDAALGYPNCSGFDKAGRDVLEYLKPYLRPAEPVDFDDDLIDALMNEHDMGVPDNQLASPALAYHKAHRNGVKAIVRFLNKHGYKPANVKWKE